MKKVKIYVFAESNYIPRYVGKTKRQVKQRVKQHLNDRFKYKSHFYNWLNSMIANNMEYHVILLDEVEEIGWEDREIFWIKHFRNMGYPLTNMTDGGDGNQNQVFSKETIEKRRQKTIGQKRTPEQRKNISDSLIGRIMSDETKAKLRKHFTGKPCPQSCIQKLSKPILQYTKEKEFVREWPSISEASRQTNTSKGAIQNVCVGRQKLAGGFYWQFLNKI